MANGRGAYTVLNDEQKQILAKYYDEGMMSTGPNMHGVIEEAASRVGVSLDKVKKWIGNERKKRKASVAFQEEDKENKLAKPPLKRKMTGYNLFCSKVMSSDECKNLSKPEKLVFTISKWKALPQEECDEWRGKARDLAECDASKLTIKQKKTQISKVMKQILSQLSYLETLGCEASLLLLDLESEVTHFGTDRGLEFLNQNSKMSSNFGEFFECSEKEKFKASDVAALFNDKYREASGKQLARVPYLRGGFEVTGLPEGVAFKKPTSYGANTIQAIMHNADTIKFSIVRKQMVLGKPETTDPAEHAMHGRVLARIIEEKKIGAILSRDMVISEQDLEVTVDLLPSEFRTLVTDLNHCFQRDAMISLISNYQSGLSHKGYTLPIYTDAEEDYWLFYFPGSSCDIEKLHSHDEIRGYWLDKSQKTSSESELKYKLLGDKEASIRALNVVCWDGELGSLRFKNNHPLSDGATVILPTQFHSSVLRCLNEQGFL